MKIPVENKIVAGFVVTAVTLGGAGWLSYRATIDFISAQRWVTHTQEVISQLEAALATVTETDTEQRGYLLTGDARFLEQRKDEEARFTGQLNKLKQLTADNPVQQTALQRYGALTQHTMSLMDDRIAAYQKAGLQAALAKEPMETTEAAMDDVRQLTAKMLVTEEKLLAQRREQSRISGSRTEAVVITGSLLAVLIGWVAVLAGRRDLKLRTLAERRLQQNEERIRLTIAAIRDYAIVPLDSEGHVTGWNEGAQRIKGYAANEIVGQHFSKFYPQEAIDRGLPQQVLVEAKSSGRFEDLGWRVRKNGSQFWADVVVNAVRNPQGELLGFVKVTRDLTEQRRAEQVREERDRYFELTREMLCVAGFDGYFKTLNPAWKWTLGFSEEELLARPFLEFVHPDDRAATQAEAERLMNGGEIIYFENRYLCKDGSWRWFAWSATSDLPRRLVYATARDVTERKLAQEKIERLNENLRGHAQQLEEANKELEAFSYSVSHDLRAPLRHIDGFVRMLVKQSAPNLDERGRRYLDIIADSAQRMGALIDDLLAFSRMSRAELRRTHVSNESLVHEAVNGLQHEINGRHIQWDIEALPEVDADPSMLQQVWVNLISNAVKYTRTRDPAEIKIGCAENRKNEYTFFVHDNGVGFDMQYAHKLFGVFQRLHRAEEFEGTGIGLANVSRIVHRHGGRVWAEGRPNAGATFYFSLPKTSVSNELSK